nr:MAG TPA: hypothetical protein [Caudoviricetes sp.]
MVEINKPKLQISPNSFKHKENNLPRYSAPERI